MQAFYLLLVWLHILAAAIWIGGTVFLALVVVPVARWPDYRDIAAALFKGMGIRFRWVGWACFGVLVVSGTFILGSRGFGWADVWNGRIFLGPFGSGLRIKLLLVTLILLISSLHDFVVGPRATALWQANPTSLEASRLRQQASWLGRLNLLVGLIAVAFGVILVRGWPSW